MLANRLSVCRVTTMIGTKTAAVVGLGYVGLPVALLAARRGWQVTGLDIDADKVASLEAGKLPLVDDALQQQLDAHPFSATTDFQAVSDANVIVVAVPTPVTDHNQPDLEPLKSALTSLRPHLQEGQVLIIESTINPGVMDEVIAPLLGDLIDQIHLAHCPERINPGDSDWPIEKIPRVIGGQTPAATEKAAAFYESILDAPVMPMGSMTEAEAVKILENTFRDINIAYINEMAKSFSTLGIDITNVIAGAATKPFAFLPHYPGNGVGGHCISVDPYYMIERARQAGFDHKFLKLARSINESMPQYTVDLLDQAAQKSDLNLAKSTIALLGVTYKADIDDIRHSPALEILDLLKQQSRQVVIFDPYRPDLSTTQTLPAALAAADVIMLGTNHQQFVKDLTAEVLTDAKIKLVIDGKNCLDADSIAAAGIAYRGIGRERTSA